MKVEKTSLKGVFKIYPPTNFQDHRGSFVETYNENLYKKNGIDANFVQDDISTSRKNVLRGLHGDQKTTKLISCLLGSIYLMVVNNDQNSDEYMKWEAFNISDINRSQILVPPKFGNGYLALTDKVIFHYKQSTYYNREGQFAIGWNDKKFNFWWPIKNPILSRRDDL